MYTYTILANTDVLEVEFEGYGKKFTKRFIMPDDAETFLQQKLDDLETLTTTFATLQNMRGVQELICEGWHVVYDYVAMPADWIEVYVTVVTPTQELSKTYNTIGGRTLEYIGGYMNEEKSKVAEWVANSDVEALTNYFGQEVTV
jgi:hypothetical protein